MLDYLQKSLLLHLQWIMQSISKVFITAMMLMFGLTVYGQFYKPNETTLRIGDNVPDTFWSVQHDFIDMENNSLYTADLSRYRDKVLILDFWASWCGPCIYSLGKMRDLQSKYPEIDFEVVPVAYESVGSGSVLANRIQKMGLDFQSIIQDSILGYNFPHNSIPHMVWIYKGKVIAKPKWDYVTIENIQALLQGRQPKLVNIYQDSAIDPKSEFFVKGNGKTEVLYEQQNVKIARHIPEYQIEFTTTVHHDGKTIMYAVNAPLSHIYYEAFRDDIHPLLDRMEGNGLIWAVRGDFREKFLSKKAKQSVEGDLKVDSIHEDWNRSNLYSFVIEKEGEVSEREMRKSLQNHLNTCFQNLLGIYASIHPAKILKYAVMETNQPDYTLEKLGKPVEGEIPTIRQPDGSQRYTAFRAMKARVIRYLQTLKDEELEYGMLINNTGIPDDFSCDFLLPEFKELTIQELGDLLENFGIRITIENDKVPALLIQQVSQDYKS